MNIQELKKRALLYDLIPQAKQEMLKHAEFTEDSYFRKQIHVDDDLEIVLVCFKSGQKSPKHDHGDSNCVVHCLQGTMHEILYALDGKHHENDLCEGGIQAVPVKWSHYVENISGNSAVLLNFYSPPLKMNV